MTQIISTVEDLEDFDYRNNALRNPEPSDLWAEAALVIIEEGTDSKFEGAARDYFLSSAYEIYSELYDSF